MLTNIIPYYIQWNIDVNDNSILVHKQEAHECLLFCLNSIEIVDAANL